MLYQNAYERNERTSNSESKTFKTFRERERGKQKCVRAVITGLRTCVICMDAEYHIVHMVYCVCYVLAFTRNVQQQHRRHQINLPT